MGFRWTAKKKKPQLLLFVTPLWRKRQETLSWGNLTEGYKHVIPCGHLYTNVSAWKNQGQNKLYIGSMFCNYKLYYTEYSSQISTDWLNMSCCNECCSVFICSPSLLLAGTQSQLNLERSKSRMGTFVEGGPMAETNPEEGYETSVITSDACLKWSLCRWGTCTEEQQVVWWCHVHRVQKRKGWAGWGGGVESNLKLLP